MKWSFLCQWQFTCLNIDSQCIYYTTEKKKYVTFISEVWENLECCRNNFLYAKCSPAKLSFHAHNNGITCLGFVHKFSVCKWRVVQCNIPVCDNRVCYGLRKVLTLCTHHKRNDDSFLTNKDWISHCAIDSVALNLKMCL